MHPSPSLRYGPRRPGIACPASRNYVCSELQTRDAHSTLSVVMRRLVRYEGWHAPAVSGLKDAASALTVERVLRSNGSVTMQDMAHGIDLDAAMGFYYQKQPIDGFYCIYRKRANESKGVVPDCLNISSTLHRHAQMLNDVNVSFVVADSTNIVDSGPVADVLQLRPFEVLAEEWLAMREQGLPTPQISIWQQLAPGSNLWRAYVDQGGVYNNSAYDDLIFKDAATGKKVLFATKNPDPAIVAILQAAPYNLAVVTMWAQFSRFDSGEWSFFSPCTDATGAFTSSVYSSASIPCNQSTTTNSPIGFRGTSLTVGPSYQLSYSSLPFMAAGKLGGLTLKKQFQRAFELHSQAALDYLFVGTFNEHIAQPQLNPYNPPNGDAVTMGLENDPFNVKLWVDMYGDAISRDLEPTKEDGGKMWALFESCMRVRRLLARRCFCILYLTSQHLSVLQVFWSGAKSCDDADELCCQHDPASTWSNIWSLTLPQRDTLLTNQKSERDSLVGQGWLELCAP